MGMNFNTRPEALEWALYHADDGEEVAVHDDDCKNWDEEFLSCSCDPLIVRVLGFRSVVDGLPQDLENKLEQVILDYKDE